MRLEKLQRTCLRGECWLKDGACNYLRRVSLKVARWNTKLAVYIILLTERMETRGRERHKRYWALDKRIRERRK